MTGVEANRVPTTADVTTAGLRARQVVTSLEEMWGDELPPSADPVHTVMTDAVHSDDEHGRDSGLVVQGDGLSLDALVVLLRAHGSVQERLLALPPALAQRLVGRVVDASVGPDSEPRVGRVGLEPTTEEL